MYNQIRANLATVIDINLVNDLLDEYKEIKNFYFSGQHEHAINKSGKYVETVFQILKYILSGELIKNPNINNISKELEKIPKGTIPESIRIIIPRSANAMYTIRSRRGAAHKSHDISPNNIDSEFVISICDWILAEFLRLYHNSDIIEVTKIVNCLVKKKIPIIEEFGDDLCILSDDFSNKEEILLVLYHYYPETVSNNFLTQATKGYPQKTAINLKNAENERLVYRKDKKNILTRLGLEKVENLLSERE